MSEENLNVESLGHLSARCNAPLRHVLSAIDSLGIRPVLVVDDVAHLNANDAQRVAERIAEARARKAGG